MREVAYLSLINTGLGAYEPDPQSKFRGDALDDSTRKVRNFREGTLEQGGGGGGGRRQPSPQLSRNLLLAYSVALL